MLPGPGGVAAPAHLVALKAGDGSDQQARIAVGPQRGVDVKQLTGGGAQRQPGDELAHKVAVDLLGPVRVGFVGVVVQKHQVQVTAVAQLLAAQLAVGDDGKVRHGAVVQTQPGPGPTQGAVQRGVGQRRQVIGHLLHGDQRLHIAHQGAEHLGMVGMAQGVEQRVFVVLATALQRGLAVVQLGAVVGRAEALGQQAGVRQLVDHAGVAHQILHRPARQAQQTQQAAHHLGPLDQQGQVALAPQQRLQPVDEAQRGGLAAAAIGHAAGGALDQPAQAQLAVFAQRQHAGVLTPLPHPLAQRGGQAVQQGIAVHRQRQPAALAGIARAVAGRWRLAVMQEGIKLGGHQLADFAQAVQQRTGLCVVGPGASPHCSGCRAGGGRRQAAHQAQRRGDPRQVSIVGGQQMGLLVIQVLDAVLDLAQNHVGVGQLGRGVRLHQAAGGHPLQAFEGGPGADLRELPTPHHQQQLHDEFNLADAAAREFHVICPLRPAGGAALGFFADLAVQLAQALENAVVQVTPVDKRADQAAQRQRPARQHRRTRRHHPALEPGKTLPLAALHQKILFQHGQADHRRAGVAVGPQRQIHPKHKTVVGGLADQRVKPLCHRAEVFMRAAAAAGVAVVFVEVDQVDVGRHVELTCAQLAHADDPEVDQLALAVQRRAAAGVFSGAGCSQRNFKRGLGQLGHGAGDVGQRGGLLYVQHRQPLQHQLAHHPQGRGQGPAGSLQAQHQCADDGSIGQAGRQQRQVRCIPPAHPLHKAAVGGTGSAGTRRVDGSPVRAGCVCCVKVGTHGLPGALC